MASPKCQISWLDKDGLATPDTNNAIGIAHVKGKGDEFYFICATHLYKAKAGWLESSIGWTEWDFINLKGEEIDMINYGGEG